MKEDNVGESRSSPQAEQSAPKEISSTAGQMKVSQTGILPSGTAKKLYLMECDEVIATGEKNIVE